MRERFSGRPHHKRIEAGVLCNLERLHPRVGAVLDLFHIEQASVEQRNIFQIL